MSTGDLIRQTRQAEGLTQAALARRLGITQPAIARLEAAGDEVTVATLQRALNAMGRALSLTVIERPSSVDETLLVESLRLTPGERIERFEREYANVRSLASEARQAVRERSEFRPRDLVRSLVTGGVDFVVVGDLAAVVHGSRPTSRTLEIAYSSEESNLTRIGEVLVRLDARLRGVAERVPFVPERDGLRGARILTLDSHFGPIDLIGESGEAPIYASLRERAETTQVAGVRVLVASLDDLIAMKKAAGRPKDLVAVEELEAIQRLRRELG
jgi:transcriptional regulator with XRE-family HTH domain